MLGNIQIPISDS